MVLWLIFLVSFSLGYYLPANKFQKYKTGRSIPLYVNSLRSPHSPIPYSYYELGICKPKPIEISDSENIGQILTGEILIKSNYKIEMNTPKQDQLLCKGSITEKYRELLNEGYTASWQIDNLPAGYRVTKGSEDEDFYSYRFPIGEGTYIYNHHDIIIEINEADEGDENIKDEDKIFYIVGFLVKPESRGNDKGKQYYVGEANFTYSVIFEESDKTVTTRWNPYFNENEEHADVHWLSILNSLIFVAFLSYMIACIIKTNVNRDVRTYREREQSENEDDYGWKQVSGEVFRSPSQPTVFWVIFGSGLQLFLMLSIVLFLALIGFLTPNHRGHLLKTAIILYFGLSFFAANLTARYYKKCGGDQWSLIPIGLVLLVPLGSLCVFLFLEMVLSIKNSSEAVGFWYLFELVFFWIVISFPLAYIGSILGFKKGEIELPCRVNRIPRPTVNSPFVIKLRKFCLVTGLLPFGSMLIELNYIMQSLWNSENIYFFFGFLFLSFILFVLISAEVSILMTYILLSKEDGRWWWISAASTGSAGLCLFFYSFLYEISELQIIGLAGKLVYYGYMLLISVYFALISASIGIFFSFLFVRQIYTMIKND